MRYGSYTAVNHEGSLNNGLVEFWSVLDRSSAVEGMIITDFEDLVIDQHLELASREGGFGFPNPFIAFDIAQQNPALPT